MHFYSKYRLSCRQNLYFALFLTTGTGYILFDIATAYTRFYSSRVAVWLNTFLHFDFYILELLYPIAMFLYVISLANTPKKIRRIDIFLSLIPMLISFVFLCLNQFNDMIYYFDGSGAFVKGILNTFTDISTYVYPAFAFISVFVWKKNYSKIQVTTIAGTTAVYIISLIVQNVFPEYPIIGLGIALSIVILYLSLQNPDTMLNGMTGTLNESALKLYIRDRREQKKSINLVYVAINEMLSSMNIFGVSAIISNVKNITGFLNENIKNAQLFYLPWDRFIIMSETESGCEDLAIRICDRMKMPWIANGVEITHTVCIYYATGMTFDITEENLMTVMDKLMVKTREKGIGSAVRMEPSDFTMAMKTINIGSDIQRAIADNDLTVCFQPIYAVEKAAFNSAKAVVSYCNGREIKYPEFISIAEHNGTIIIIGAYILEEVCKFLSRNSLDKRPDFQGICIKLSAMELMQNKFPENTIRIMKEYGIAPNYINFEIPASIISVSHEVIANNIKFLNENGFSITIDNFGTGLSNIGNMFRYHFQAVKLARSVFIDKLCKPLDAEVNSHIFNSTLQIAHDLGLFTIIEGCETKAQMEMLKKYPVDYIQGNYLSYFLTADDYIEFLNPDK
jgi:EAL domain-containing protein (putative c-di-GMP-specific phosphodiesterase class I)